MNDSSGLPPSFVLVVGADPLAARLLPEAAGLAYPGIQIRTAAVPDDGRASAGGPAGLAVLCEPGPDALAKMRRATDAAALPQFAVVVLGGDAGMEGCPAPLPRERWSAEAIARELQWAWAEWRWRREQARLRGDLATFGHRVAHDLRTPLGGVLTTTEMLREILAEDCPENVPLTQPILESTDGLVKLIERVSFFAKALSSTEPVQRVAAGPSFWNAYQKMESQLLQNGVSLRQPSEWPEVRAHANGLEAVWRNLIENAVRHGGREVEAGWSREAGGVRFWLRDSGTVAAEKQAGLFFPFHRLHEPGAPRGLGLPIVRALVERDGGRCGFVARAEGGSEFFFVLPG